MQENRVLDKIKIRELEIYAYHGVFSEERKLGQHFYVNADLFVSTRKAGLEDNLELSVNYGEVCEFIHHYLTEHTFQLLEAAAEHIVEQLLLRFDRLQGICLEIRKPQAPIPYHFDSVSVEIKREWKQAIIACGSNLGEKEAFLEAAVEGLKKDAKCRVLAVSDWIVTEPYGGVEQDDFLNGAIRIETLYEPEQLLDKLNALEAEAGRERLVHWGPRTLDLDLIFYEDEVIQTNRLKVPHADMQNRDFVLTPVAQLVPHWRHPVLNKTVIELKEQLGKC